MRWEFREHETEYDRLVAKKPEKGPGVQLGQQIAAVDVEDRELAFAIGRHFLDRFAEEAAGRMSLEIHSSARLAFAYSPPASWRGLTFRWRRPRMPIRSARFFALFRALLIPR